MDGHVGMRILICQYIKNNIRQCQVRCQSDHVACKFRSGDLLERVRIKQGPQIRKLGDEKEERFNLTLEEFLGRVV